MTANPRNHQRGFTLVELMVVVIIIGILIGAFTSAVRTAPDIDDVAHRVVTLVHETSRKAVAAGAVTPIPADPGRPLCRGQSKGAATKLRIYHTGGRSAVALERFDVDSNDPNIASWKTLEQVYLGVGQVTVTGYRQSNKTTSPILPITSSSDVDVLCCYPNGQCDSATILLERGGSWVKRVRIEVLPLGGTGSIFDGW